MRVEGLGFRVLLTLGFQEFEAKKEEMNYAVPANSSFIASYYLGKDLYP